MLLDANYITIVIINLCNPVTKISQLLFDPSVFERYILLNFQKLYRALAYLIYFVLLHAYNESDLGWRGCRWRISGGGSKG
jgi:hypothetical protein